MSKFLLFLLFLLFFLLGSSASAQRTTGYYGSVASMYVNNITSTSVRVNIQSSNDEYSDDCATYRVSYMRIRPAGSSNTEPADTWQTFNVVCNTAGLQNTTISGLFPGYQYAFRVELITSSGKVVSQSQMAFATTLGA